VDEDEWDKRYADTELLWSAEPNVFVARELDSLAPGRALDLGAGEGRNSIWLASRGWTVTAVDFSQVALDRGASLADRAGVSVEWVHADLRHYEPRPAIYDLVLVVYLQLIEKDLRQVLAAARSAVAPGGTVFVVGHDRTNITDGYGGPQDPGRLYTPELVTAALDGLEIATAERVNRAVATPDGERIAIDTLVRATKPARR
jgi:2-polyprenyl-3-methyl-5-hydroxy-6-metoxy-1,4-benzoquinol methylase